MRDVGGEQGVQVPIAIQLLSMVNFRWLWLSKGLALMGFQIRNMGQAWITLDLTGGSQFWVGVVDGTPGHYHHAVLHSGRCGGGPTLATTHPHPGVHDTGLAGRVRRKGLVIAVAASTVGCGYAVFGLSIIYPLTLGVQLVIGVAVAFWITTVTTVLRTTVPDEMRGRVMGVYFMAMQFMGFGWILGGYAAQTLGNEMPC